MGKRDEREERVRVCSHTHTRMHTHTDTHTHTHTNRQSQHMLGSWEFKGESSRIVSYNLSVRGE